MRWEATGPEGLKAAIPAARARDDAAMAGLQSDAAAPGITHRVALDEPSEIARFDIAGVRARFDAHNEGPDDILATVRPAVAHVVD